MEYTTMNNIERKLLLLVARYLLFKLNSRSGIVPYQVEQEVRTNLPLLIQEVETKLDDTIDINTSTSSNKVKT